MTEILAGPKRAVHSGRALCAEVSAEHAEPLAATASHVEHWLAVEYRGLWPRDTLAECALTDEIKAHVRAQLAAMPRSRLLFLRRPARRAHEGLAVFYGRTRERERRFYRLEIESYEELLGLDFAAGLDSSPPGHPLDHPLLVVCTHGKRDRCCAKYGRPLYDELCDEVDEAWVWQSTHVGGDRFAGNVVCLPEGLYYGRVERRDVWSLLDEYLAGRIELEHYRGRCCYGFAAQAAERRIRQETGLLGFDDLLLDSIEAAGEDASRIRFQAAAAGSLHEVDVVAERGTEATYLTCTSPRPQRPVRHVATAYRRID